MVALETVWSCGYLIWRVFTAVSVEFFHVEMISRTDMVLDQLNLIDDTFSSVEKFEPPNRYTTLQSLYTPLDHQLQDGLMGQHEFDRMRYIVQKLWNLKLQIHMIEKEDKQPSGVIGHIITSMLNLYTEGIISRSCHGLSFWNQNYLLITFL